MDQPGVARRFRESFAETGFGCFLKKIADRLQRIENVSKTQAGPRIPDEQEAPHFGADGVVDAMASGATEVRIPTLRAGPLRAAHLQEEVPFASNCLTERHGIVTLASACDPRGIL